MTGAQRTVQDERLTPEEVAEVRRRVVDLQLHRNLEIQAGRPMWWIGGPCNGLWTNENIRPDGYTIELVIPTSQRTELALYEVEGLLLKFKGWSTPPSERRWPG